MFWIGVLHFFIALIVTRILMRLLGLHRGRPALMLLGPLLILLLVLAFDRNWLLVDVIASVIAMGMASATRAL